MSRRNRNRATRLRTRVRDSDPMAAYDDLPTPLRRWLQTAALLWSPQSALKIQRRTMADGGCPHSAAERCGRVERAMLARDRIL